MGLGPSMGMPGQSRGGKFLFDNMGPAPIYSAITQQDFTEYFAFYYEAKNLLTSKAQELLIKVVRKSFFDNQNSV